MALAQEICELRQDCARKCDKMRKKPESRSSTDGLEIEMTEFIADKHCINAWQCSVPGNRGVQKKRHEHVENTENVTHFRHLFTIFVDAGVTVILKKFECLSNTINYLGHVIHSGQLADLPHTIDAIGDLNAPPDITEILSFLGFCNVFRRFAPYFA